MIWICSLTSSSFTMYRPSSTTPGRLPNLPNLACLPACLYHHVYLSAFLLLVSLPFYLYPPLVPS